MADMHHIPVLGGPAPLNATRTAQKLAGFACRHIPHIQCLPDQPRYLDIGCGNGFITEYVARDFRDVVGIDIEPDRLRAFRERVHQDLRYNIMYMSSDTLGFSDNYFSLVTAFEVLEHVVSLEQTVAEMVRVCQTGGVIVVSVPQVGFPFENHGMRIGKYTIAKKIPLLPYIGPLHRKFALARVFSSRQLDTLFCTRGMELLETRYAAPQFERAAVRKQSWEYYVRFLRPFVNVCERVPGIQVLIGVSILKAYRKLV